MMNRSASWSLSILLALVALSPIGLADEGSVTSGDLDARLDKALFQTINTGVPIFNRGDAAGCYRLYQGSLIGISPFLAHRPDLQASVSKALASADASGSYEQKAVALRATLDDIRAKVNTRPLWARLGGEPAVKAVVHDFVVKAAGDPKVDFFRGGKYSLDAAGVAHLETTLVELVSTVSGGPLKYSGKDMKSVHAGMGITDEQFGAIAGDLIEVLKSYKVPQKEINELVGLIATTKKDIVEPPK
jgi:hemoglobin